MGLPGKEFFKKVYMGKESITIKLLSCGYRIEWGDGTIGVLMLTWGLRADAPVVRQNEATKYSFFLKWRLELNTPDSERSDYSEEVGVPVEQYQSRDSFQGLLADALKKIFMRSGQTDPGFVAFMIKHFDIFFTQLKQKLQNTQLNISLTTDIFEQALLLNNTDLNKVKGVTFTYPEKKVVEK